MLEIRDVSKSFDKRAILDGINLSYPEAQTHVILGESGCGKSTLLRMIAGLLDADTGSIRFDGGQITRATQPRMVEKIGYVIQDGGLFPHLSAKDNVCLRAKVIGWKKPEIEARLKGLQELVGLDEDTLNRFPKDMSGGQRQRVGLMRALMLKPPLLLLDEPLGALDPIVRSGLQEHLKRIFNSLRCTVIIVTHDIGEAAYFGHTVTLLHEGRIAQHGTFPELVGKPASAFVTEFINAQRPPAELEVLR